MAKDRLITVISNNDRLYSKMARDRDSSIVQVLLSVLSLSDYEALTEQERVRLHIAVFSYIMHTTSFLALRKAVLSCGFTKADAHSIKDACVEKYEASIGLRQCVLIAYEKHRQGKRLNVEKLLKTEDISLGNAYLLRNVSNFQFLPNARSNLLSRVKETPLLLPHKIKKNCEQTMQSINVDIKKLVYRKLRFIKESNGYSFDDLFSDLTRKGVEAYYRVTPFQVDLHRLNTTKKAIHYQAMKEITYYTADKRSRLLNNDGVFSARIETFSADTDTGINEKYMIDTNWQNPYNIVESGKVIEAYVAQGSANRASIVNCLLHKEHTKTFKEFCAQQMRKETVSLDDLHATYPTKFVALIADYHEVPALTVRKMAWDLLQLIQGNVVSDFRVQKTAF